MKKTNAARYLESQGISYRLVEYEVDENDLGAVNVAIKVGMPPHQVFKTLVARGDKTGVILACVPGDGELDLKAVAGLSGNKRVEMVPLKEVQPLTGYMRGGVSPLLTRKPYPVYIDESALSYPEIAVSAGARGCQLVLNPVDLIKATGAMTGKISRSGEE